MDKYFYENNEYNSFFFVPPHLLLLRVTQDPYLYFHCTPDLISPVNLFKRSGEMVHFYSSLSSVLILKNIKQFVKYGIAKRQYSLKIWFCKGQTCHNSLQNQTYIKWNQNNINRTLVKMKGTLRVVCRP